VRIIYAAAALQPRTNRRKVAVPRRALDAGYSMTVAPQPIEADR
jgi:hypothetical protein